MCSMGGRRDLELRLYLREVSANPELYEDIFFLLCFGFVTTVLTAGPNIETCVLDSVFVA